MTKEQILQSSFTKTKKAILLFELGYTRAQVAELVTNNNYGFAYNIWKKWSTNQTNILSIEPAEIRPFEFNFNRTFGIELEIFGATRACIIQECQAVGIEIIDDTYNHNTRATWKIVSDSSIGETNGCEIVSPILTGADGLEQIKKITIALNRAGAKVGKSCGFHVHFGANDLTANCLKNLVKSHIAVEPQLDAIVPVSRRENNNTFCLSLTSVDGNRTSLERKINSCTTIQALTRLFPRRYIKLNLQAYVRQGTIEFRQHSGTITYSKIKSWILICARMVEYSKHVGQFNNLNQITNESLQDYINDRAIDLAV